MLDCGSGKIGQIAMDQAGNRYCCLRDGQDHYFWKDNYEHYENGATICNDNKDNDCDGLVDCCDPDCNCKEVCGDNKDNDCDNKIDCADSDCAAGCATTPPEGDGEDAEPPAEEDQDLSDAGTPALNGTSQNGAPDAGPGDSGPETEDTGDQPLAEVHLKRGTTGDTTILIVTVVILSVVIILLVLIVLVMRFTRKNPKH
jgi:hypothetical protein